MNVKSVEKETSKATVTVELTKAELEPAVNKAYLKYRKDIAIPGFRKGKAPRVVIEAAYGKHVFFEDAIEEMFPQIYQEAVMTQDMKPVGRPSVSDMNIADDDSVTLTIVTDLYPAVTLGQYKGIEVEKVNAEVKESEVDAEIDRMAQNVARISTVERPAKDGDTVVIDFEGFLNGVAFKGGKGENHELVLGSGSFIPGFEEQVVGMSAGEEKDINVTFPENYHASELAGKEVTFKVKVHEVKETVLPEKDDEFVKDVSEFDTMAELRADIEKRILDEKQAGIDRAFENAAVEKAAENMTAEIPDSTLEPGALPDPLLIGYDLLRTLPAFHGHVDVNAVVLVLALGNRHAGDGMVRLHGPQVLAVKRNPLFAKQVGHALVLPHHLDVGQVAPGHLLELFDVGDRRPAFPLLRQHETLPCVISVTIKLTRLQHCVSKQSRCWSRVHLGGFARLQRLVFGLHAARA